MPTERSRIVAKAHFKHAQISAISIAAFSQRNRSPEITREVASLAEELKSEIYKFVEDFEIDLIIPENALTIPMNIPLGLALTDFIAETGFPTIAHHHDFFWERSRFLVNCVWDYLNKAFPPHLPSVQHVVINSSGANQLALRTGISSTLIPNVMDFENPPPEPDEYTDKLRQDLGVQDDELFFLQPTRVVQRKGIEHSIELIKRLDRKARLVISHASGDEGDQYEQRLRNFAQLLDVPVSFVSNLIRESRGTTPVGERLYSLWDVYPYADLVTYPSTVEGFGNAFLEAIYFCRPILVNNYSIFDIDIKPRGFEVIEMDGYINENTLAEANRVLENPEYARKKTSHNYELARKHYSYSVLERHLYSLLTKSFGM
jgi:glycosyltransferase involved in cell wall biosynthesis